MTIPTSRQKPSDMTKEMTSELLMFFGRLDAKLDTALQWIRQHEMENDRWNERVQKLERNQAWILGAAAALGAVASLALEYLIKVGAMI